MWDNLACCHARGRVSDIPRTLQRAAVGNGVKQLESYGQSGQGYHFIEEDSKV
jgi:hypothetical protein